MSMFLSLGIVVSMSAQKFNVASGSPVQYRAKGGYHITFVSQDLVIGKFPSEQSYVDYMIEQCNAIKPDSGAVWAHEWQSATNELYKPKFMTLFNKHSLMGQWTLRRRRRILLSGGFFEYAKVHPIAYLPNKTPKE